MLEAIQSLFTRLQWRQQEPQFRPLPDHVKRVFVPSAGGDLEILVSSPTKTDPQAPAIFFAHGGYGSAGVWLEWMTYLHNAGYAGSLYAYSARNHGASYTIPFFRMVYRVSMDDIESDLKTCYDFARNQRSHTEASSTNMVLVGHSSGGGLSQHALANNQLRCRALCLLDAMPHFGMLPVYTNWARHDPWFMLRNFLHWHPSSPLSSPNLVYSAFFGHKYPKSNVSEFMKWMPAYESMAWPTGQMGSFWAWLRGRSSWLNVQDIIPNISGTSTNHAKDSICMMVGSEDMMVDLSMCGRQAAEYRNGIRELRNAKALRGPLDERLTATTADGTRLESFGGVRVVVVEDAGHHLQNDVQADIGAKALLEFVQQA